jgi:isopentenyl-diphosphate delta-isomerase
MEQVILVNEFDVEIGQMEKMEAHIKGLLHRAFSIFIFNNKGEMLLQQRALKKYHSGGLWTNACCSHPRPTETTLEAANRRLKEEMGFNTALSEVFDFSYKVQFSNSLFENEFDHVFVGYYDGKVEINVDEVESYAFRTLEIIDLRIQQHPNYFTEWFLIAYPKLKEWLVTEHK